MVKAGADALEPLAGALLAINLAYIALPNFRYRDRISQLAKDALHRLEQLEPADDKCGTNYSRLVRFSGSMANGVERRRGERKEKDIPETEDTGPSSWLFLKSEWFGFSNDVCILGLPLGISLLMLLLGVSRNADIAYMRWADAISGTYVIDVFFTLMIAGIPIPAWLISRGRARIEWASKQIEYLEKECRETIVADRITEQIPSSPPKAEAGYADLEEADIDHIFKLLGPKIEAMLNPAPQPKPRTRK